MNLLQYTSDEMFSATELIRKSKNVFDKLQHKQIDKAVILRDGKPSFIMMDFAEYEKIIGEYLELKCSNKKVIKNKISTTKNVEENQKIEKIENLEEIKEKSINDEDFQHALKQIEDLELNIHKQANQKIEKTILNDFWEEV